MPKQVRDENKKRINWFARNVKLRATPVFPGIEYRTITPAVKTLEDQEFLSFPPQELAVKVIRLSPHIFFSLPAVGLKVLETGLNGKLDDQAAFDVSRSDYKGTDLRELLHRVVRDPNSEKINFDSTYQKLNELVKTANHGDRSRIYAPCEGFEIGGNVMTNEDATKDALKNVLEPICGLFSSLWKRKEQLGSIPFKYKNQLDESDKISYSATPDIFVTENGQPLVCIKVKRPFIDFSDDNAFSDVFTQAVSQCVASGTPYGVVTDYFNTLCFKLLLEEEDIQSTKNNTYDTEVNMTMYKRVKVMHSTVNHRDSVNTLACVLAAHIFDASMDMLDNKDKNKQLLYKLGGALQLTREEIAIRDRQSYEKFLVSIDSTNTRQDGKISFKFDDGREDIITLSMYEIPFTEDSGITIIHEGPQYNAQVLRISGEVFHKITGVSPNDDHYILKIFDPVKGRYKGEETRDTFLREYEAYDELKSLWGQCVPRFYHAGYCSFHEGARIRFGGLFMIFQFIEGSEPDLTDNQVVDSAEDGLDMMHTHGVIHGDVVLRNMIQTADKKVFLVDFGLAGDYETGNKTKDLIDLQHAIRDAFTKN